MLRQFSAWTTLVVLTFAGTAVLTSHHAWPVSPSPYARANGDNDGIWISRAELVRRPAADASWARLESEASKPCGPPALNDQNSPANVCVMAKALVHVRTGDATLRREVASSLRRIVEGGKYEGRALALGRELAAYVIAADAIDLPAFDPALDARFRVTLRQLLVTPTTGGPSSLIECHERRPNNWGTHCGGSRAAVAAYLDDRKELARVAQVFKGWLGDRASYAGFRFGDLSWQCNESQPVGVNPAGCTKEGHSIDGVVPDDQRRAGRFTWPPPKEQYVYGALSGALVQAVILERVGYPAFEWQDRALLRAFEWLHREARFPAEGDDTWQLYLVNEYYGTAFPAPRPARPGKAVGWTDWTHGR